MNKVFKFGVLLSLLVSISSFAGVNENLESYYVKKNVTDLIGREIDSIVKTKLTPDSYQVNITVDLSATTNNEKDSFQESKNADYRLKLFDMQRIISSYKYNDSKVDENALPKIDNLEILVGVSENYTSSFRSGFQTWFKDMVAKRIGKADVAFSIIKYPKDPKDKKDDGQADDNKESLDKLENEIAALKRKIEDEVFDLNKGLIDKISDVKDDIKDDLEKTKGRMPASEEQKSLISHIKDFQQLLGWLIFGIFLFVTASHFVNNLKPQVELDANTNTTSNKVDGEDGLDGAGTKEVIEDGFEALGETGTSATFYDHDSEVAVMLSAVGPTDYFKLVYLFDYWMQGQEEDVEKFWYLMSLCVSKSSERPEFEGLTGVFKEFIDKRNVEWTDETKVTFEKKEVERIESLIMSDLVRLKAFGEKSFKQSLSALQGLKDSEVAKLFADIGEEDVLFLYLNEDQRDQYLKTLSSEKKLSLLESAFKKSDRDHKALEKIESKVDAWIDINKSLNEVKRINLADKIMKSFSAFTSAEKMTYIEHAKMNNEESYNTLCLSHFHPLWAHQLKDIHLSHYISNLNYKALLYTYAVNEDIRPYFSEYAAPRVMQMIKEENLEEILGKISYGDPEYLNAEKMIQATISTYLADKKLDLSEAYRDKGLKRAA